MSAPVVSAPTVPQPNYARGDHVLRVSCCTAHQGAAEIIAAVTAFSGQPGLDRPRAAANSLGGAIALKLAANGHV